MKQPARSLRSQKKSSYPFHKTLLLLFGVTAITLIISRLHFFTGDTSAKQPLCPHCNVVVISIDTLSALHLPCYGYAKNTAPNLCAFAVKHSFFPQSYAQSYFTLPSHFSLFTSQYPSTHGMLEEDGDDLDPAAKTLTETLKDNGYNTLYFGPPKSNELPLAAGIGRGFDYINPTYDYDRTPGLADWQKGIDMLKTNAKKNTPTFLFLHTYYVHEPYLPGSKNAAFGTTSDLPTTKEEFFSFPPQFIQFAKDFFRQNPVMYDKDTALLYRQFMATTAYEEARSLYDQLTKKNCALYCLMTHYYYESQRSDPEKVAAMSNLYDTLIYDFDRQLKTILASLSKEIGNDTILIITADHGEAFMEHGSIAHRSLYNEVLRVPLIISVPGVRRHTISAPVESIDVYPTILGLLGLQQQSTTEGADLTALIRGTASLGKSEIISERYDQVPANKALIPVRQRTLVTDQWKLYLTSLDAPTAQNAELYDAIGDPWDRTNIAALHPDIVMSLLNRLTQFDITHRISYPGPRKRLPPALETVTPEPQRNFHY
jgi:arylsulfatase A-like enzyme